MCSFVSYVCILNMEIFIVRKHFDSKFLINLFFLQISTDVVGEFHPEERDIPLEQILLSSLLILMVYISSHAPINLLWKGISGSTTEVL